MNYHLSIEAEDGSVYYEKFQEPFPIPRVGEDVFVGGEALGNWTVTRVNWSVPSMRAMEPGWWVVLHVEWSTNNNKPNPVYDEDKGWIKADVV